MEDDHKFWVDIWKEMTDACLKEQSRHSPGETEENHQNFNQISR
jgi:hypothetical protein